MSGNKQKHQKGFTLIEVITASGVFVVLATMVANLYIVYSQAQRSAGFRQKIISEMTFAIEKMAQEIRVNEVIFSGSYDYNADATAETLYTKDGAENPAILGKENELGIFVDSDESIYYLFDSAGSAVHSDCNEGSGLYRLATIRGDDVCQKLLEIDNLEIVDAGFYIQPSTNPYPDSDADCGPSVSTYNGYYCTCSVNANCWTNSCVSGRCVLNDKQPRVTFFIKARDLVNQKDIYLQTTSFSRTYKR